MKKYLLVSLGATILFVLGVAYVSASEENTHGAKPLFNRRDLA